MSEYLPLALSAVRGELVVLLRWPVVWCLCFAVPAMMIVAQLSFIVGLQFSPPDLSAPPGGTGTWGIALNYVVPTVFQLLVYGSVIAMVIGAVVVAADWERGTARTNGLTTSGRVPVALGRAIGVWLILSVSAILAFAAAVGVCALAGLFWPQWFLPGQTSMPPLGHLGHGVEVLAFTNVAYGGIGLAAGALMRKVGPAIILCVIFALGVEPLLSDLGSDVNGVFAFLYKHTPDAAATTLSAPFGSTGGGGIEPPTSNLVAHVVLWVCFLGFAGVQAILEFRGTDGTFIRAAGQWKARRTPLKSALSAKPSGSERSRPSSTTAAVRAELGVIKRWPGLLALAAVLPVWTLLTKYAIPYGLHVEKVSFVEPSEYVPWLLPHRVLAVTMNYLDPSNDPLGVAAIGLLGAWLAASSWGENGTLSLALTQGQSRIQVVAGQAVAAIVVAACSALATVGVAITTSEFLRLALTGDGTLPSFSHLVVGIAETLLVATTYVIVGWAIGFLAKSVGVAMVVVLGWVLVLQPWLIEHAGPLTHGPLHWLYNALPETPALSLAYAQGTDQSLIGPGGAQAPTGGPPAITTSVGMLCLYVLIAIVIATAVAVRREVRAGLT